LFLDTHVRENGFTEIWPPILINEASARGTGQIPDKEDQMYVVGRDGFYLAPTAEVPVTNMHRDEILDGADLPIRYAAYTPCFRREAGAAGRETRGILRLHQFDKVEMVSFERPAESAAALEWLTARAESLLKQLELPYRVLLMATGDMGFVQMRKYDLEVWAPGSKRWLEVSSCSNFGDYQARRMAIRYRTAQGEKPELVHTLNGSGLAVPRVLAALLEHGAQPDGAVVRAPALSSVRSSRTAVTVAASVAVSAHLTESVAAYCSASSRPPTLMASASMAPTGPAMAPTRSAAVSCATMARLSSSSCASCSSRSATGGKT
jgi:seryl-tRNA synthetase